MLLLGTNSNHTWPQNSPAEGLHPPCPPTLLGSAMALFVGFVGSFCACAVRGFRACTLAESCLLEAPACSVLVVTGNGHRANLPLLLCSLISSCSTLALGVGIMAVFTKSASLSAPAIQCWAACKPIESIQSLARGLRRLIICSLHGFFLRGCPT